MRLFGKKADQEGGAVTARIVEDLLGVPPPGFDPESYALVASAVLNADPDSAADRLLKAVRRRQWSDLSGMREWEARKDNLEVYAVSSPEGRLALLTVVSPFEPFDSDRVVERQFLNADEGSKLSESLQPDWRPLREICIERSLEIPTRPPPIAPGGRYHSLLKEQLDAPGEVTTG